MMREGGALATNQNRAACDWHHRPHRPKRTHSPPARGVDMFEQLAFALVAVALAAPFLVPLLWSQLGQSSKDTAANGAVAVTMEEEKS
jgi:hypothetical protein